MDSEGENVNVMTSLIHKYMEWEEAIFTSSSGLLIWQFSLRQGFVIVSSNLLNPSVEIVESSVYKDEDKVIHVWMLK